MAEVVVRHCAVHVALPRPWGWASRDHLSQAIVRYILDIALPQLAAALTTSSTRGSVERLQVDVHVPASAILPRGHRGAARSGSFELVRITRAALEGLKYRVSVASATSASSVRRADATTGAALQVENQGALLSDGVVTAPDRGGADLARTVASFFSRLARDGRLLATLTGANTEHLRRWAELFRSASTPDGEAPDPASGVRAPTSLDDAQEELTRLRTSAAAAEPTVVRLLLVFALVQRAGRTMPTGDIWAAADAAVARSGDQPAERAAHEQAPRLVPAVAREEPTLAATARAGPGTGVPSDGPKDSGPSERAAHEQAPRLVPAVAREEPTLATARAGPGTGVAPDSTRHRGDVPSDGPEDSGPPSGEVLVQSALPFLLLGPLEEVGVLEAVAAALAGAGLEADLDAYATALAYKVLPPPALGWLRTPGDEAVAAAYSGRQVPLGAERLERLAHRADEWSPMIDAVVREELVSGHDPVAPLVVSQREDGLVVADADGMFPILWSASRGDLALLRADLSQPTIIDDADAGQVRRLSAIADALDARPSARCLTGRFERHVDLCASLALATIAWRLWRDEETGPLLTLERFADLDAVLRFTDDAVSVRLALGRRHADLRDAGLLRPVVGVPWLGGRTVELSGG